MTPAIVRVVSLVFALLLPSSAPGRAAGESAPPEEAPPADDRTQWPDAHRRA